MLITVNGQRIVPAQIIQNDIPTALREYAETLRAQIRTGAIKEGFGDRAPEVEESFIHRAKALSTLAESIEANL